MNRIWTIILLIVISSPALAQISLDELLEGKVGKIEGIENETDTAQISKTQKESEVINNAVFSELSIIRQQYRLERDGDYYGKNNEPYYGETYSLSIKVTGGMYLLEDVVEPWKRDADYQRVNASKNYKPVWFWSYQRALSDSIYKAVDDLEYYREVAKYVPIGKPVWSYWVSSKFGAREDPFNKKAARHKGIDLASRQGNKIKVMAKGKVIRVNYSNKGYGNLVEVDHGNGFKTKYAHMHKIYVKEGDILEINDAVGEVGSTGRSTGPHLHYEILYRGRPVDPMPFMLAKIS